MAKTELKYVCRHRPGLKLANTGTCEIKKAQARRNPDKTSLDTCRGCPGPLPLDSPEARQVAPPPLPPKKPAQASPAAAPACKHHPDRPAVLDKNGRSQGVCAECLAERTAKARAVKESGAGRSAPGGPADPRCKHHPDRPAKIRKDGRSSGLCAECIKAATARALEARREKALAAKARVAASRAGAKLREFDEKSLRSRKGIEREAVPCPAACSAPAASSAPAVAGMTPAEARRFTKKRAEEMLGSLLCRELGDLTAALQGRDDCIIRTKAETVCRIAETLGEAGILPGWVAA